MDKNQNFEKKKNAFLITQVVIEFKKKTAFYVKKKWDL